MKPAKGPGIAPPAKTAAAVRIALKTVAPVAFVNNGYNAKSPDNIVRTLFFTLLIYL